MNNLSVDNEFRYIVQWFNEWSELQRDDFVPIIVEYLKHDINNEMGYVNGVVNSVAHITLTDKPMSLFQCRIKLFRQWTPKWPLDFKEKLKEKIIELDPKIGEQIINEINSQNVRNVYTNGNISETMYIDANITAAVITAHAIVDATEDAIQSDNRLNGYQNNESRTVNTTDDDGDDNTIQSPITANNISRIQIEPAEQVQSHRECFEEEGEGNIATTATGITVAQTVLTNTEMPLLA